MYTAFKRALERYLKARRVRIPILDDKAQEKRDDCVNRRYQPPDRQPDCVVGGVSNVEAAICDSGAALIKLTMTETHAFPGELGPVRGV